MAECLINVLAANSYCLKQSPWKSSLSPEHPYQVLINVVATEI